MPEPRTGVGYCCACGTFRGHAHDAQQALAEIRDHRKAKPDGTPGCARKTPDGRTGKVFVSTESIERGNRPRTAADADAEMFYASLGLPD